MINNNLGEPPRPHETRAPFKTFGNPKRLRLALYLGAAFSILLFVLGVSVPLTFNPTVCGFCHSMSPEVNAWEKSSHAQVTCYGCHGEPSFVPLLVNHFRDGITGLPKELGDDYEKPINATSELSHHISADTCLRCHSPQTRSFTVTKGLAVDSKVHLKHLDAGVGCPVCHNRVAHKAVDEDVRADSSQTYLNGMNMFEGCLRCHHAKKAFRSENGRLAPTKCDTCHTSEWELKPESHADLSIWRDQGKHGEAARPNVFYCLACHGGREETGIKECVDCHGVSMPHPSDWKQIHFKVAAKIGRDRCAVCHTSASQFSCNACHHKQFRSPEPWVTDQPGIGKHMAVAREEGMATCFKCHKPVFCPACHVRGLDAYRTYRQNYLLRENP